MTWTETTVPCPRCGTTLNIGHSDLSEPLGNMVIHDQECRCWLSVADTNEIVLWLRRKAEAEGD